MTAVLRRAIFALGLTAFLAVPAGDAEARGAKVRSSSRSTAAPVVVPSASSSVAPAAAATVAATAAAAATTPEQAQRRDTYMLRAERALKEERELDTDEVPELTKPSGAGATIVTGPPAAAAQKLQCVAGC